MSDLTDLEKRFMSHPVSEETARHIEYVRHACLDLAVDIDNMVPASREKSLAITNLEEVMFWANAGIARNKEEVDGSK